MPELNLPHSPTLPITTDCQTREMPSGQIPHEPEQETDGCGGRGFEKRKVLRGQWQMQFMILRLECHKAHMSV